LPESLKFPTNTLGPIQYIDPQYLEIISTMGKNKSSDIFSLGIILWEISSGNPPFEIESLSNVDLLNSIVKGKREMVIPGTPTKYKEIYTGIQIIILFI
jgi:serine/threonine protein kinase